MYKRQAFYSSKTPDPVEDTEPKTADTAVTESDESDACLLYTSEKKKILKHDGYYYVVNPYALEWKNDHYYLIGFSLKHQKIAHFRVRCV